MGRATKNPYLILFVILLTLGLSQDVFADFSLFPTFVDTLGVVPFPLDIAFSSDGTKMFLMDFNDNIYEYHLTTAFDISTAGGIVDSVNVQVQDTDSRGFAFNSDGTKMFTVGRQNDAVYEYDLSPAFDVSTAVYSGNSFSVAA